MLISVYFCLLLRDLFVLTINRWKQGEIIGHGSYGKVIMGLNIETGCMMAVKQVQIGGVNTSAQQDVRLFSRQTA